MKGTAADTGGKRVDPASFGWRGGWWVLGQSVLMLGVVLAGVLGGAERVSGAVFAGGWGCFVAGGILGVLGVVQLGRGRTAYPRPMAEAVLVTRGVYGKVRHPLYVSVVFASLGWSMIWGSWGSLAVTVVLALFLDAKARREERWLRERFGEYAAYARRVRRWIPGVY